MAEPHITLKKFISRSVLGGVGVILPIVIIAFFFIWLFELVSELIRPVSAVFIRGIGVTGFIADMLTVVGLIAVCFLVGNLVATRFGSWVYGSIDSLMMNRVPGYKIVKDVVGPLFGTMPGEKSMRGEVARVYLFGKQVDVSVTSLVTSCHEDGRYTVFVPTGPNPTSGMIYHVAADLVEILPDVNAEKMMKTVIACGAGSDKLFLAAGGSDKPGPS